MSANQVELPVAVAVVVDNQVSVEEQVINVKPKRKYVRKPKVAEPVKKSMKIESSDDESSDDDEPTTTNDEVKNIEDEVALREEQQDEVAEQIQNLQKDEDDDIDEQVRELLQKQKELQDRLKLLETAKKVKKDISDYRKTLIDNRKKAIISSENIIKAVQLDIEKAKGELEAIDGLQDDELSEMIMSDPNVIRELNIKNTAQKVKKSAVRKTPAKKVEKKDDEVSSLSSGEKSDKSKAYFQRKEQWNYIPQGTKLELIYNKSKRIYTKKGDGLVDEEGKEYKSLNDAVKKYKASIGDTKGFGSAWSMFKVV